MRIMAGDAADARIGAVEAFAVGQTVGLEADGQLAAPVVPDNRFPGAMTLAAEIRDVFRRPLAEIGRSGGKIAVSSIDEVSTGAGMTMLAGHSGAQRVVGHFAVRDCVAGVTAETDFGLAQFDLASNGFFEVLRFQILIAGGEIETRNRRIEAHRALVTVSVVVENPGLRALAKVP